MWRGYKGRISSQVAKLTSHEIKRRYNLAVECIDKQRKDKDEENFFQPSQRPEKFKKPTPPTSSPSSTTAQSSSSSSRDSSDSLHSEEPTQLPNEGLCEETTQIPETQYEGMFSFYSIEI